MNVNEHKKEMHDTEEELLQDLVQSELAALWARIEITRRSLRNLTEDESAQIALGNFDNFTAALGIEYGNTREEFVRSMGEAFDIIASDMTSSGADGEEEEDDEPELSDQPPS